jgi:photosystem II stability/assembly factor-like uncharacterized protein
MVPYVESGRPRRRQLAPPVPSVAPSHAQLSSSVLRIGSSEYVSRTLPGDDGRMKHTGTLSILLFSLLLWSCGGDGTPTSPTPTPTPVATLITLSVTSLSLASLGATSQLSATVKDQNGTTMSGASVSWFTSDATIATVSSSGLVTAVSNGTATITATIGSITVTATISDIDLCGNAIGNGSEIISGPAGPSGEDYDSAFRSLAVDPSNPNVVYLGTERNGIVKTTDGGTTWERLRSGLRHWPPHPPGMGYYPEVWDIAVSPHDPSLVIAATLDSPGPVVGNYPSTQGGVYRSEDGGATWERSNCGLTNSRAVSVRFDPSDPDAVVLGIEGGEASSSGLAGQYFPGALLRSEDRGHTWEPTATLTGADHNGYWHLRARPDNTFITFAFNHQDMTANLGFLRSTDGGQNWTQFAPSLRDLLITAFDVSADGQTIYAGERDVQKLYRSLDGGVTWVTINTRGDQALRVSPVDPNLVLFSRGSNDLYLTIDGFTTTETVLSAADEVQDIEFALSDPNIVYAATTGYSVYRSDDAGASFTLLVNLRTDGIIN